jgi:hypothetical protein
LKLRVVSAGGCNACEADVNVLGTVVFDLGRFGIQYVASPRHADGLLITGPVTENMRSALRKTYDAVPPRKIVIAVGACAISGGPYVDHPKRTTERTAWCPWLSTSRGARRITSRFSTACWVCWGASTSVASTRSSERWPPRDGRRPFGGVRSGLRPA